MADGLELVSAGARERREWATLRGALRTRAGIEQATGAVAPVRLLLVLPPSGDRSWQEGRRAVVDELARVLRQTGRESGSATRGAPVDRVFVLSSMRATGATERSAGFATEEQPVGSMDAEARQWRRFEEEVAHCVSAHPGVKVCVLRCCFIEGVHDGASRLLEGRFVWTRLGFDPPIQVLSVDDLCEVLDSLLRMDLDRMPPTLHVAPDDAMPLSRWLHRRGRLGFPLPGWLHAAARRGVVGTQRRLLQRPATLDNALLRQVLGRDTFRRMVEPGAPFDGMGWKQSAVARLGRWCLEPLRRVYWRVSDQGVEHVPETGPTLLVGIHRGYMPLDAMMLLHLVQQRVGRTVRFLIHPALLRWPFLADLFPSIGGLVAASSNADRVLASGGLLGVFPEGANAAMVETRRAYPLRPFLSDDFAHWAVRWNAKVVPVALVGPAEALPIFRRVRWRWWRRQTGWPTLPIGFLFPFGPPIPLPTKWHILFLEPIGPEDFEHEDEGERARALAHEVRHRLDASVRDLVRRRRSLWRGELASEGD